MDNTGQSTTGSYTNDDAVGAISREQFETINENGAAAVASVTPRSKSFSESDWQLFLQIAVGGTRQLELSQAVSGNITDEDISLLADAEIEEQTGLSDKLKEFADYKGLTLPSKADQRTLEMVERLQNMSGAALDQAYIQTSGVIGHENLDKVMSEVTAEADDLDLKALAEAAHPLVRAHLQVAQGLLGRFEAR